MKSQKTYSVFFGECTRIPEKQLATLDLGVGSLSPSLSVEIT